MLKGIFCFLLFLVSVTSNGQSEIWHPGVVVTTDNLVLTGNILYQGNYELVVVRCTDDPVAHVLQAKQLKSFRYYDDKADINRKFISTGNKLYEEVVSGNIAVWRKSKSGLANGDDRDDFIYFFSDNQVVYPLMKFRSILYPKISTTVALQEKTFHLNPNRPADVVRYIQLYNKSSLLSYTLGALP